MSGIFSSKKRFPTYPKKGDLSLKANFGDNHPYIDATLKSIAALKNPPPAA
ncbi:MAG: hypothetical protein SFV22_19050 [Saprospiraceae bacterium]|nr:hypothetical protein [Saprospiraceae bacterium]